MQQKEYAENKKEYLEIKSMRAEINEPVEDLECKVKEIL